MKALYKKLQTWLNSNCTQMIMITNMILFIWITKLQDGHHNRL